MDSSAKVLIVLGIIGAIVVVCVVVQSAVTRRYSAQMRADAEIAMAGSAPLPGEDARHALIADRLRQKTPQQLWIATTGTSAVGRVVTLGATGQHNGPDPVVDLTLEVGGPDGPYTVEARAEVNQLDVPSCQPGSAIRVRVDPGNRDEVVFLFDGRMVPVSSPR
jgi:hypothetical protein